MRYKNKIRVNQTEAHCRTQAQADAVAAACEKIVFIARLTGQGTGGKAQICLPDPRFRARINGFQHQNFLDSRPFPSERVQGFGFRSCPGPFVLWKEQGGAHRCYSYVVYPRVKLCFWVLLGAG